MQTRKTPPRNQRASNKENNKPAVKETPTFTSTAERLLAAKKEREDRQKTQILNEAEYAMALNAFAASDNGKIILKPMLRYMGWAKPPSKNGVDMVELNGMRRLYVELIRPYLEPTIRAEIEDV